MEATNRIRTYIQSRLEAEAAAGTVNRDLEACSTGTTSVSPADLREVARRLTPSEEPRQNGYISGYSQGAGTRPAPWQLPIRYGGVDGT
jgi:hypothetical protein